MPKHAVINFYQLETGLILAPERYDPRRQSVIQTDTAVVDVAKIIGAQVSPGKTSCEAHYLVLDTSDAWEGIIRTNKKPTNQENIGSAKKLIQPGDVIISRLRPYLRQVAYVDTALTESVYGPVTLLCSTEFFVLRSSDNRSIAFLVPYLLSDAVQKILSASQEGGHHPRFNKMTLERISIPNALTESRDKISADFESAVSKARHADLSIRSLVTKCNNPTLLQSRLDMPQS